MGKTIILASLMHTNRGAEIDESVTQDRSKDTSRPRQIRLDAAFKQRKAYKLLTATLVVAPTSLINQWGEELRRCSVAGSLEVHVWHGQNRLDLEAALDVEDTIQVVVTSYGVLASEHAKHEKSNKKNSSFIYGSV
jgi:DNA repair protein RAD5